MTAASLPSDRAFVLRLDGEADPAQPRLCGRIEHLESGRRARIASAAELQEFVFRVLAEEGRTTESSKTTPKEGKE